MEYKIPLKKTDHQCLVSQEDYEHLKQFKFHLNNGYVKVNINKKDWAIHRYIMIELLSNKKLTRHNFIDHINGNKLDNRRENLRIVSAVENAKNKLKAKNSSSKYFGVIKYYNNQFQASIKINNKNILAFYKIEDHAAYQYDLWIKKYKITHTKINNIQQPDNFIEYSKKEKGGGDDIPKGIVFRKSNKTYFIKYKNIHYCGVYKTLEDAEKQLRIIKENVELKRIEKINSVPIKKNEKGECIIELCNRKKEKVGETIVDEEDYYNLMKYAIYMDYQGYVIINIDNKSVKLHRYIMNYYGEDYVDHINNNKLDNRKCNLRIVTPRQNSMNQSSTKNSSSKYIGVNYNIKKNKWKSNIKINNLTKTLGYFDNEEEAAKVRDISTKEYFGEFGNLNFP
jgi:hypothetical protein